jgi:hypothetical protein
MKGNGVVPYAYSYDINTTVSELRTKYSSLPCGEEDASVEVSLAGRIMVRRFFGKLAFFALQDETDTIQLYVDKGRLGKQFKTIQAWTDNGTPPQPLSVCLTLCLSLSLSLCSGRGYHWRQWNNEEDREGRAVDLSQLMDHAHQGVASFA